VPVIKKRSRNQPTTSKALPVKTTCPALWDSDDDLPTPKRYRVLDDEDPDEDLPDEDPSSPKVRTDSSEPTYLPPRPPHNDDNPDDAPTPPRAASTRPSSTTSSHKQSRASSSVTEGKKTGKSPASTSSQRQRSLCALRLYHRSRLKHTRFSLHLRRDQGPLQPLPPTQPTTCILFMTSSKEPIPTRTITLNDETIQEWVTPLQPFMHAQVSSRLSLAQLWSPNSTLLITSLPKSFLSAILQGPNIVGEDIQGVISLLHGPDLNHQPRSKHMRIRYAFIKEQISNGRIAVEYTPTTLQQADTLTKPTIGAMFLQGVHWLMGTTHIA
jgi:hypothetical protein